MNEDDRKILQRNRSKIVKDLHNVEEVNSKLFEAEIFNEGMKEEVEVESTKERKIRKLLDILPRRGPAAFQTFIQVLIDTQNEFLADVLYPNASATFPHHVFGGYHQPSHPISEDLPATWPDPDVMEMKVKVIPCANRQNKSLAYRMSRDPRGRALLINNKIFYGPQGKTKDGRSQVLPTRHGTDQDKDRVTELFVQLHFTVTVEEELTAERIREVLRKEICHEQHQTAECFVLVIMTHGCAEGLYGVDGEVVSVEWIKQTLNGANFPCMADKPKLVFIQACRGESYDTGVVTTSSDSVEEIQQSLRRIRIGSTVPDSNKETRHPTDGHMLIAMATTLDMVSFRNVKYGSWFLQAVVYIFQNFAHNEHIFDLMMKVSRLVSMGVAHSQDKAEQYKAISVFESTLTNHLYFFPGIIDKQETVIAQPSTDMK